MIRPEYCIQLRNSGADSPHDAAMYSERCLMNRQSWPFRGPTLAPSAWVVHHCARAHAPRAHHSTYNPITTWCTPLTARSVGSSQSVVCGRWQVGVGRALSLAETHCVHSVLRLPVIVTRGGMWVGDRHPAVVPPSNLKVLTLSPTRWNTFNQSTQFINQSQSRQVQVGLRGGGAQRVGLDFNIPNSSIARTDILYCRPA